MKTFFVIALSTVAVSALSASAAGDSNGATGLVMPPGQPLTPEMKAALAFSNAISNAVSNAVNNPGGNDPQAMGKQISNAVSQVDFKPLGLKTPVQTPADAEKLSVNLAGIKDLFDRANAAWKLEHYREAALLFRSVAMAT